MKKIVSVVLSAILILTSFSIFASAEYEKALKFNSDGKFKILHVADIQDNVCIAPQALECIAAVCDDEQPDLVILGGDNISSAVSKDKNNDAEKAFKNVKFSINLFMSIFEERNIPTATVFGNHDGNHLVPKEKQMEIYQSYDCFIGSDENAELYGCNTSNIPIMSSDSKKTAYNLWLFDSGEGLEDAPGYDWVHDDQVEWYVKKSNELKKANGGKAVDSMAFQHIPIFEIHEVIENGKLISGELNRTPRPSLHESSHFSAIVKQGDIKAMFFGHDHVNTYTYNYKGIDFVATPTSGVGAYGDENKGIRVIELDEKDTSTYKTRMVNYLETYCTDDTQYSRFKMNDKELEVFPRILHTIRYIFRALEEGTSFLKICYEIHCILT